MPGFEVRVFKVPRLVVLRRFAVLQRLWPALFWMESATRVRQTRAREVTLPALAQEMTLPSVSVMVTMVLLKLAWT